LRSLQAIQPDFVEEEEEEEEEEEKKKKKKKKRPNKNPEFSSVIMAIRMLSNCVA
jgi:hypothetical protein